MNLRVALCQLNPTTGDLNGNLELAETAITQNDADIYVFSECFVTNYPCDDMFANPNFKIAVLGILEQYKALSAITASTIILGTPIYDPANANPPTNGALVIENGVIIGISTKDALPNYGVFDDPRWFAQGQNQVVQIKGHRVAISICEDLWTNTLPLGDYDLVVTLNSSPFGIAKAPLRRKLVIDHSVRHQAPVVYVNQVGGNDELVWDGGSMIADGPDRVFETQPWAEGVSVVELAPTGLVQFQAPEAIDFAVERYIAAVLGLRDYVRKNEFEKVVFGNSGGADSCLVALMTADAFGPDKCLHVMMPSQYTSNDSNTFATDLSRGLGVEYKFVPIGTQFSTTLGVLEEAFGETPVNVAEENLQAQLRGDVLSWISNKYRYMIIATGNKSESSLGFFTSNGDDRGGFAPLKDLYKHNDVFELLAFRRKLALDPTHPGRAQIERALGRPLAHLDVRAIDAVERITARPPSAELAPGQVDTDSMPDYAILDAILWELIDARHPMVHADIAVKLNVEVSLVQSIANRVQRAEFKRSRCAPGAKIHQKAFTRKDWRMPVTNRFNR